MIVFVGCGKDKLDAAAAPAHKMYVGQGYLSHMELARRIPARRIMILSAEHGLIDPSLVIDTYDTALSKMSKAQRMAWAKMVAAQASAVTERRELVIVLAGAQYLTWSEASELRVSAPLAGMTTGERRSVIKAWVRGLDQEHDFSRPYGEDAEPEPVNASKGQVTMWGWFSCDACGLRFDAWAHTCSCGHRGMTRTDQAFQGAHPK